MDRRRDFGSKDGHRKRKYAGVLIFLAFTLLAVMLPPFYLATALQSALGWPVFWVRVLVCAVWMVVLYAIFWLLFAFSIKRRHKKDFAKYKPRNMFDDALDALDQIAQGDYNVHVETDDQYHYSELVDKINNVARQLSSMEQMRQDFVSNVSHEIRSPLTSITGFAQLLKKDDITEEERLHYVEVIQSETERMFNLSDSLLRLSVLDNDATKLNPAPFRLDKQLQSVLLAQELEWAGKDIELDIQLDEVICTADEELLLQVWQNLLQNAIKFTAQGGHIQITLAQKDGCAVAAFRDDGVGMSPEDLLHVFERFYKVDRARDRKMGGNGLGLPLAKRIVVLHGGQIRVESAPNAGTTFTVTLPLGADEPGEK